MKRLNEQFRTEEGGWRKTRKISDVYISTYFDIHPPWLLNKASYTVISNSHRNMSSNFFTEKFKRILNMALDFSQENYHSSVHRGHRCL